MGRTRYAGPEIVGEKARSSAEPDNLTLPPRQGMPAQPPKETPLSSGQLRLWFLEQLEPGTALYNMPMVLRLKGPLDTEALQRAVNALVARHESLRTRFVCQGEYPVQVVDDEVGMEVEMLVKETPNSKLQTPGKLQTSNSKLKTASSPPEEISPEEIRRLIREE